MTNSGILLIDKPQGPSSAQVVRRAKAILNAKKVGHLGTLDPFASGLLLLGVNEGTKIADVFLSARKSYRGIMVLGVATDSQDSTGKVVRVLPAPIMGVGELKSLEEKFTGELRQIPPMFSALKRDGVRLYQLARQGKAIPREPRSITIEVLRLQKLNDVEIEFEVTCSRGTYVRTLAADMGEYLGCGAHLKSLRRTACGRLTLANAITLESLERLKSEDEIPLMPLQSALNDLRAVTWQDPWLSRLRLGQQEILERLGERVASERLVRIVDGRGDLVALAEWCEEKFGGRWQLFRVFHW